MTLDTIRDRASAVLAGLSLVLALSTVGVGLYSGTGAGIGGTMALMGLVALGLAFAIYRTSAPFRYLAVAVLMGQVMALLVAAESQAWQTDVHMAFFAALAVSALLYDVRAIVLGTVLVAVHHLGLGMILPDLVFFGGGSLERIALHAVILLVEAGGLIWMTRNTLHLFGTAREQSSVAEANADAARTLAEEVRTTAEAHRSDRKRTMAQLRAEFGTVAAAAAEGDFSRRVRDDFAEDDLNFIAISINRLVTTVDKGLAETSEVLNAMSQQDLTRRVTGDYHGAFGRLKCDTNAVADRLSDILSALKIASRNLRGATGELSAGAGDLASRTSQQASTVQHSASSVETLTEAIAANVQRAVDAGRASSQVVGIAGEGGVIMKDTTSAMDKIARSSQEISGIIGLIDDIAFQTNLLALNASVEAARAGEAGKGFAVVAVEVRRLAQSAAQASAQVKALINQAAGEVSEGTKLVAAAGQTLARIVEAARSSHVLMQAIADQAETQQTSIEDVNETVQRIDQITQHNAGLVEETNAAIAQTESEVAALDAIVTAFKTQAQDERAPERRYATAVGSAA